MANEFILLTDYCSGKSMFLRTDTITAAWPPDRPDMPDVTFVIASDKWYEVKESAEEILRMMVT